MASKIQSHNFYVAITPYKVEGVEDQYNELSVFTDYNQYTHQFYVSLHAGWKSTFGHGSMIMGGQDPLTASTRVNVKESPRNSQKTINEIGAALELAKDAIAWLFDQRMWPELRQFVKDVALCGYTYDMEQRIKGYKGATESDHELNELNENNNQNSETMAQNVKAADLIGKVIIIGGTSAKYVVKSIEGDKLQCDFVNDGKTTPMSVTVSQVQKFIADGKWEVKSDVGSMTADAPQASDISPQTSEVTTEADVQEVEDIVPVVTPRAKSDVGSMTADAPQTSDIKPQTSAKVKPIGKKSDGGSMKSEEKPQPSAIKPQTSNKPKGKTQTSDIKPQTSKYVYSTYQTKKGKTGAKITGVSETDAAYQQAAAIHASGSYERDKQGNKHYYLCFGPRYAEAAKKVCELLNAGKPIEDAIAIIDKATEERATKREEWKQKREERKAQTSAVSPQTSKGYSAQDVAEMLRKVLAGGDVPEDIKAILAKQAA